MKQKGSGRDAEEKNDRQKADSAVWRGHSRVVWDADRGNTDSARKRQRTGALDRGRVSLLNDCRIFSPSGRSSVDGEGRAFA